MKVRIIHLSEEVIARLPFPDTARTIGGLLVLEDDSLANHLNIEKFRQDWNKDILGGVWKESKIDKENK